jgi:hypothetical protein
MEVVGHHLGSSSGGLDGRRVYLEELLGVVRAVILLLDVEGETWPIS